MLVVLVPRGVHGHSTGTTQAVLDHAPAGARLVFSCGWHITRDGQDAYSRRFKTFVKVAGWLGRLTRSAISTTRWRRVGGCLPATRAGPSCAEAISRRARARACPCGAGTRATPSLRATSRLVWTLPSSWWETWRMTSSSTRLRRLSVAERPPRSLSKRKVGARGKELASVDRRCLGQCGRLRRSDRQGVSARTSAVLAPLSKAPEHRRLPSQPVPSSIDEC